MDSGPIERHQHWQQRWRSVWIWQKSISHFQTLCICIMYHLKIFPVFCSLRVPDGVPHHLRLRDDARWRCHLYHHRCRRGRLRLGRFPCEPPGYSSAGKAPSTPIHGLFIPRIFYRPQRSWAKVIFLQVSVILLTGGCLPQCMLGYPPEQTLPGSRHPWEQTPPWRRACWEIQSIRGRYASYWNAFLLGLRLQNYRWSFPECLGIVFIIELFSIIHKAYLYLSKNESVSDITSIGLIKNPIYSLH